MNAKSDLIAHVVCFISALMEYCLRVRAKPTNLKLLRNHLNLLFLYLDWKKLLSQYFFINIEKNGTLLYWISNSKNQVYIDALGIFWQKTATACSSLSTVNGGYVSHKVVWMRDTWVLSCPTTKSAQTIFRKVFVVSQRTSKSKKKHQRLEI